MGNSAPAHIGDMEETVDAAEIDECTEVGDVLHDALANLIDFHFLEEGESAILAGFFEEFAAGDNDVLAILVDLEDLEVVFFADVVIHVLDRTDIDLRTGEECFNAIEVDDDTAFDAAFHETLDDAVFTEFTGDLIPCLDEVSSLEADSGHAVFIFCFFEENVDFITDLNFFPVTEFCCRNESFRFVTDVDQGTIISLFDDFTGDNGVFDEIVLLFISTKKIFHGERCGYVNVALCCCCHCLFSLVGCEITHHGHLKFFFRRKPHRAVLYCAVLHIPSSGKDNS